MQTEPHRGVVVAEVVDADELPENATVVDAAVVEPSESDLDGLLAEAVEQDDRVGREYALSKVRRMDDQLSTAPEYDDKRYLRYEGDIVRVTVYALN